MPESTSLLDRPRAQAVVEVRDDHPQHHRLPLWLTLAEAEALLALSITSPLYHGSLEEELFPRVSAFVQTFDTPGQPRAGSGRAPLSWAERPLARCSREGG